MQKDRWLVMPEDGSKNTLGEWIRERKWERERRKKAKAEMTEYEKFKRRWDLFCKLKPLWLSLISAITSVITTLILLL